MRCACVCARAFSVLTLQYQTSMCACAHRAFYAIRVLAAAGNNRSARALRCRPGPRYFDVCASLLPPRRSQETRTHNTHILKHSKVDVTTGQVAGVVVSRQHVLQKHLNIRPEHPAPAASIQAARTSSACAGAYTTQKVKSSQLETDRSTAHRALASQTPVCANHQPPCARARAHTHTPLGAKTLDARRAPEASCRR